MTRPKHSSSDCSVPCSQLISEALDSTIVPIPDCGGVIHGTLLRTCTHGIIAHCPHVETSTVARFAETCEEQRDNKLSEAADMSMSFSLPCCDIIVTDLSSPLQMGEAGIFLNHFSLQFLLSCMSLHFPCPSVPFLVLQNP